MVHIKVFAIASSHSLDIRSFFRNKFPNQGSGLHVPMQKTMDLCTDPEIKYFGKFILLSKNCFY